MSTTMKTTGLKSSCPCQSGETYGKCCFRLELAYLVIGFFASGAMFAAGGLNDWRMALVIIGIAGVLGFVAKRILKKKQRNI